MWEWDWQGTPREHQRPILGRWAALAVRIDHDVPDPPPVITRVLDSDGAVLAEGLDQAAPPSTVAAASGGWRTEYVFELPGSLYQAGHQLVHVIDPDDVLAETDEDDNAGEPIVLYGDRLEPFRVTFIPLHYTGDPPPQVDAEELMFATRALPADRRGLRGGNRRSRRVGRHQPVPAPGRDTRPLECRGRPERLLPRRFPLSLAGKQRVGLACAPPASRKGPATSR